MKSLYKIDIKLYFEGKLINKVWSVTFSKLAQSEIVFIKESAFIEFIKENNPMPGQRKTLEYKSDDNPEKSEMTIMISEINQSKHLIGFHILDYVETD